MSNCGMCFRQSHTQWAIRVVASLDHSKIFPNFFFLISSFKINLRLKKNLPKNSTNEVVFTDDVLQVNSTNTLQHFTYITNKNIFLSSLSPQLSSTSEMVSSNLSIHESCSEQFKHIHRDINYTHINILVATSKVD